MSATLIPVALIASWLLLCGLVATGLDHVATQPMEVYVEDYRAPGLSDDQVLSRAAQAAFGHDAPWWWIRSGPVHLVFDETRTYALHPAVVQSLRHSAPGLLRHLPLASVSHRP